MADAKQTTDAIKKEINGKISRLLEKILLIIERNVAEALDTAKKNVSGDLKKSLSHEQIVYANKVVGRVSTGVYYSVFVHEGTRPHWVPIDPLLRWVEKKGIVGRYSIKTHKRVGGKATIADENMAAAKAIQRKIAAKGTAAFKFFDIGLQASLPRIEAEIKAMTW